MAAIAIGAIIPAGTENHPEYFACHPELFVQLLGAGLALGPERWVQTSDEPGNYLSPG